MMIFKDLLNSRFQIILSTGILLVMTGLMSCDKDPIEPGDCDVVPTYTADIKPILDASCAKSGCHDAITVQNGVNLSTYATARAISQEDRFLAVIEHRAGFPQMPFDGPKLPQSQIDLLTCWAENDAPQ